MDARINIRVFNRDIEFMGEIDDFTSFFFVRKWNTYGEFEIELDRKLDILRIGNYIMVNNDPQRTGVIEYINIKDEESETVIVKGFSLSFLLSTRITEPPSGKGYDSFNASVESIMDLLVDHNCRLPTNSKRQIPRLTREACQKRGAIIKFQTRYKNLLEELQSLSLMSGLGFGIELDVVNKQLVFKVYQGKNRTAEQTTNVPMIFSRKYDNVFDSGYTHSTEDYKNTVIIAGEGEEENRVVQIVYDTNIGLDRRELFVDARDIKETDNLKDRADEKLSKYQELHEFECEVDTSQYRYAWDLGDLVTVQVTDEITLEQQITEVKEVYEGFNDKVEVTFGEPLTSLKEKIERELNKPIQENGKTYISSTEPIASARGTVWKQVLE